MTTATPPSSRLYQWLVVSCAGLGMFLVALDIAVNVALPTITSHFHTDIQAIQWIIVSFVATRAGLAVAAGAFGDLFGLKKVFLGGIACYAIAVTLIAFSPGLAPIFGLRVLQGVGAGSLYAVAPAIAGRAFSGDRRGMAMGVIMAGFALGTVAGTVGAGFLIGIFGWEAAFLGRVPFCIVALALGWYVLKGDASPTERPSFDLIGTVSLVTSVVAFVLALHMSGRIGWTSPPVVGLLVATPVLVAIFVYSEFSAGRPVLDLRLLRAPAFLAACSSMFFVHLGAFVLWFIFPFYVAEALGRGPLYLGIMMALMAAAMSIASPAGGWLSDRVHPKYVGLFGTAAVALGLAWISRLDEASSASDIGARIAIVGFGLGLFQSSAYTLVLNALPAERFGTGSGSLSLAQAMGSVLCVAIGGLVFTLRADHHTADLIAGGFPLDTISVQALVLAFEDVFRIGAIVALGAMTVLLLAMRARGDTAATRLEESAERPEGESS